MRREGGMWGMSRELSAVRKRTVITKEFLEDRYIKRDLRFKDIAKETGWSMAHITSKAKEYGLRKTKEYQYCNPRQSRAVAPAKTKTRRRNVTLCESCVHAYGDDCFSIPFEERGWVKDVTIVDVTREYKEVSTDIELRKVHECERYALGRKPLPTVCPLFTGGVSLLAGGD